MDRYELDERFWSKVDKSGDCWLWTAALNDKGYGSFWDKVNRRQIPAHRASYEGHHARILGRGLCVDHICHTRNCVRPKHLREASNKQNSENRRSASRTSKSGVRGVSWHKKTGKWVAQVGHNYRRYHLGLFDSIEEAEVAAIAKRNELHTHNDKDRSLKC